MEWFSQFKKDPMAFVEDHRLKINKGSSALWAVFRFILLIGISFVLLYPVLYMISIAFRPGIEVTDPSIIWIPKTFTFDNFPAVVKSMELPGSLYATLLVAIVSAVLQLISCSMAAYGLARFRFFEKNILFVFVILSIIVPMQALTIPTYINFKDLDILRILSFGLLNDGIEINLLGKLWVFYLPSAMGMGLKSGLFVFIFRQFFRGLPSQLEQAAKIDGCGAFRTFVRIIMPLSGSVYLTVFLFSFVWHWNDYYYSVMYMGGTKTMATALATLRTSLASQGVQIYDSIDLITYLQTGCLVMIVPLLVIYLFAQRFFIQGIERTGITG